MRTITLEEHVVSRAFVNSVGCDLGGVPAAELSDLGSLRLRHMDEAGIDLQVISQVTPSYVPVPPEVGASVSAGGNDQLAEAVAAHPDRFAGFAALPLADTAASVRELDRAVSELGFVGALINGRAGGRFLDHPSLFPVLERAVALGVPLYLHPGLPTEALRHEHYDGLGPSVAQALATAAWGWHAETGLHVLRMIATGIFDRLPDLRIIIGHMGEMLPFMLERAEQWLTPAAREENGLSRGVAEVFRANFWVTTSGMFSAPPFRLLHRIVGADRILFSVDYPFSSNAQGREFLDALPISPAEKAKISHLNAERLLRLPPR